VTDDDVRIRMASGVGGDARHSILSTRHVAQGKAGHRQAGLNEMHMGIDEGRRDEPSLKINLDLITR
jgi:hypothetical protein